MLRALAISTVLLLPATALADDCRAPLPVKGSTLTGPVLRVLDGDGLCVGSPSGLVEIRLQDFDAAELHEPDGRRAKDALSRMVMGRSVTCQIGKKSYDRVIAACRLRGVLLGDRLRAAGEVEAGRMGHRRPVR